MNTPRLSTGISLLVVLAFIAIDPGIGHRTQTTVSAQSNPPAVAAPPWRVGQASPDAVWDVRADRGRAGSASAAATATYQSVSLNVDLVQQILEQANALGTDAPDPAVLYLPMPSRQFELFRIEPSSVMEPALEADHPEIMTFTAQSVSAPGTLGRISLTPLGFHALIVTGDGDTRVIERADQASSDYLVYSQRDQPGAGLSVCVSPGPGEQPAIQNGVLGLLALNSIGSISSGPTLRTYRIAIGATGEFTQRFGGGTVGGALAAIVSGINAANLLFEKELAVRLTLVANETSIIYTDPVTDGYTHLDLATMASENHTKLQAIIGAANYDLGHVFDGDAGLAAQGYAFFGVCLGDWKDKAGTIFYGVPPSHPVGLRTFTHELGHQFNAYHSFNGTTNVCNGSRNAPGAYEPGSGSSIMSYADLCGAENVPATTLYNAGALEQIINYTQIGLGATCGAPTATGNHPPLIDAGSNYTIPASTPFVLTAVGSDIDGDPVSYSWEQFDLGNASPPNTDDGTRPLFRIYNPASSPARTFPELSYILSNTTAVGQALPTTNRSLTFRVIARDNRAGGGGVSSDDTVLTVNAASGPFVVTAPNTAVTWTAGSTQTVTWNVAGTNAAPISAANVKISLSTDNGSTFPTVLAASTPNDGSETITVPLTLTSTARVKVESVGNIFFDIGNAAFTIAPAGGQPNLIVKTVATVPSGGYVVSGAAATIKNVIQNTGVGVALPSDVKFYLSNNNKLSADDTLLAPAAGRPVPSLASGASSTDNTVVTIPALGVGKYLLIAVADANGSNAESNEADNTKAGTLYVGPDLLVAKLTLSPTTAGPGATVTATVDVTNKGKVNAGATVLRLYYSIDKKQTAIDPLLATINVGPLTSGQKTTLIQNVTIPAGATSGTRYILALADATTVVTEANETNNLKATAFTVP